MTLPLVVFEVGSAAFALDVTHVLQVVDVETIVAVPLAPGPVRGIMNHNGGIVTILDPAPLLKLAGQQATVGPLLLLRTGVRRKGHVGLLVRRVLEIVSPEGLRRVEVPSGPCVGWVGQMRQKLIHVIDMDELLHGLGEQFGPAEPGEPLGVDL